MAPPAYAGSCSASKQQPRDGTSMKWRSDKTALSYQLTGKQGKNGCDFCSNLISLYCTFCWLLVLLLLSCRWVESGVIFGVTLLNAIIGLQESKGRERDHCLGRVCHH